LIPEIITFNPDGTGRISITHHIYSGGEGRSEVFTHDFEWKLARHGPLGMEDMNYGTLFNTFPKLARSDTAWTYRTWSEGMVPAYLYIDLSGKPSFELNHDVPSLDDSYISPEHGEVILPPELLDYIFELALESSDIKTALIISNTGRRVRELCLRESRRSSFRTVANKFGQYGMVMFMTCGHWNPAKQKQPQALYAFKTSCSKWPETCGYARPSNEELTWVREWSRDSDPPCYYSTPLPMPLEENSPFWHKLMSDRNFDLHPEVEKDWTC